jgi:hypothetical protein
MAKTKTTSKPRGASGAFVIVYPRDPAAYPLTMEKECCVCGKKHEVVLSSFSSRYWRPPCKDCRVHGNGRKKQIPSNERFHVPGCEMSEKELITKKEKKQTVMEKHSASSALYYAELRKAMGLPAKGEE